MRTKRDNTQEVANARHCLACIKACGALLRLYDKHDGNSFVALNDYIVAEWPEDREDWQDSCELLGLDDPYRVEREVVESLALDLGVSITYLATREPLKRDGPTVASSYWSALPGTQAVCADAATRKDRLPALVSNGRTGGSRGRFWRTRSRRMRCAASR